ncbi:hypothetical protein T05_4845 [Trichinella murrelli]|uniref:Uncharacterized protein n=1 Tax=Trichinella murrelli TaxID=144512 RepID=A0A0V0T6F0_9BILA|nr:hypothetical protein T05_4845 [Trichinella murrelli]
MLQATHLGPFLYEMDRVEINFNFIVPKLMKGATPNKLVKGVTANQMSIIGIETEPAECNATGYTSGTIPLRNGQSHLLKVDPASTGTCGRPLVPQPGEEETQELLSEV